MSVETEAELRALKAVGRVVADAIRAMRRAVRPNATTRELDAIAGKVLRRAGARSGPQLDYDFPGVTCISVNDEAVHGIPGKRRLRLGDLVKLDVTAELDGFYSDACVSVPVGPPSAELAALAGASQRALASGLAAARAGAPLNAIGAAVERTVHEAGFSVCNELIGHGIGRRIHEPPDVPSCFMPELTQPLTEGLVLTVEPIIAAGDGRVCSSSDGWTVRTADGSTSAHFEHTIVIRGGTPLVLTV
ncbi:MAG: type I methionyl aminopeptidase [Thermoleophilaceae bacterium]